MEESWSIAGVWEDVLGSVEAAMARRALRVESRFDLRLAMAGHPDCECPHHGRAECTCQYRVLHVYREDHGPVAVSLHARDGQTRIRLLTWRDCSPAWNHVKAMVLSAIEEIAVTAPIQAPRRDLA
jgi:hypothetical protein